MTFSFQKLQITSSFSSCLAHPVCTCISCFGPRPGPPRPCCPHGPLLVTTHGWQGFPSSRQHSLHKPSPRGWGTAPSLPYTPPAPHLYHPSQRLVSWVSRSPRSWPSGQPGHCRCEDTWLLPLAPSLILCLRLLISKTGTHKDSCVWDLAGQSRAVRGADLSVSQEVCTNTGSSNLCFSMSL